MNAHYIWMLKLAASFQIIIAVINFSLVKIFKWKEDLEQLPLLAREVFHVHLWFISVTLMIFGILTWRFSPELAGGENDALVWMAGGIGIFWFIRTMIQLAYYSSSHWRGLIGKTLIHITCLVVYGGLAALYLFLSLR